MINPGTMLGDRYEILNLIGTGGMADVYKAKCHKLNRFVAIKVLKPEFVTNKNFVSKFKAEAQAAAGLVHPNIVNVYDVGDEDGIYYFVMELVEGITLKNYIEKKIRLSYKEALSIAIQVGMGIEAAHNNGIIHRDIKPQNIIISREGKVKVADFGIARAATSNTITSHAMGSVHYTSPEQARGGYSDAKSDIYSIGITLFEMVTGRVPFDGENTVAIAIKHIQEEIPSPSMYVEDLPYCIEQIICKCTQKNPDRRYSNMGELIADFKHALRNPNEDFVVINEPSSNEGTKIINEADRAEIKAGMGYEGGLTPPSAKMPQKRQGAYQDYGNGYANQQQPGYNRQYNQVNKIQPAMDNQPYQGNPAYPNQQDVYYQQMQLKQMGAQGNAYGYNQQYSNPQGYTDGDYEQEYEEENDYFQPRQTAKKRDVTPGRGRMVEDDYSDYEELNGYDYNHGRASKNKSPRNQRSRQAYEEYDNEASYDDYKEGVAPKMEKVVTVLMVIAAIVIAIVAVVFVGRLLGGFGKSTDKDKLTVPNFVGRTLEEGNALLTEMEIENEVKATMAPSTEYEEGIIISQDPEEGTEIDSETEIRLVISSGKVDGEENGAGEDTDGEESSEGKAVVPDVTGKSEPEATVVLEEEGFTVVKVEEASDSVEKGNIIRQEPLGANTTDRGGEVTIFISTGKEDVEVTVPDLSGKKEEDARKALEELGLTCNETKEENSTTIQQGYVCRQSVEAGAKVMSGSNVDIYISLGAPGYKCSVDVSAPGNYLEGTDAIVVLLDAGGNELGRASTASFPYHFEKTGIIGSTSGYISVTYLNLDAQWETTSMVAVTFSEGN